MLFPDDIKCPFSLCRSAKFSAVEIRIAKRSHVAFGGECSGSKKECCVDVSDINREYTNATVHGRVLQHSPNKTSKRNARKISDGKRTVRVVCFNPSLKSEMETF